MQEIWKDIKGYEGFYQVSNKGRVKSLDRIVLRNHGHNTLDEHLYKGRILKQGTDRGGYPFVILQRDSVRRCRMIHRIVAETFLSNPDNKPQINHIDGNKKNNNVSNLEYCTPSENIHHAFLMGLQKTKAVMMVDAQTGEDIMRFESINDAQLFFGKDKGTNVQNCLGGRCQTSYGFKWRYAE